MNKQNLSKKKIILQTTIVCCITIAVVAVGASSTTTLGSDISTGGALTVTGNSTLTGAVSAGGALTVAGISTFNDSLRASSTLLTTGTATFYGNMVLGDASSDIILSTGGFQASSTAMFGGNTTFYSNFVMANTATTTVTMTNGLNFDSNTFVIDPSSNMVGIGTSSPQSKLTVYNSTGDSLLSFGDSNSNTAHWFAGTDYDDSAKFKIATSSSLLSGAEFTITKDGDIGIGTTSPMAKLTLARGAFLQTINSDPTLVGSVTDATSMLASEGLYISGKYAYVTSYNSKSLTIIDITVPTAPTVAGSVIDATYMNGASWVHVAGKYAYVSAKVSQALSVIDISDPANPVIVGSLIDTNNLSTATHVVVIGKYAYVTASGNDALTIVDISDPTNPTVTGSVSDATQLDKPESVYVRGKYAYVATEDANALNIIDISDPANPSIVGNLTDASLGSPESVCVSGKYAYVAGEDGHVVSVINVASSTNPTLITNLIDSTYLYNPETVYVAGKYLYVVGHGDKNDEAYTGDYLTIIDISDPTNPFVTGSIAGSGNLEIPYAVSVSGKYAYVASQGSNSSSWAGALSVIDVFGIDAPSASIGDLAVETIEVAGNLQVANMGYFDNGINVGARGIFTDGSIISTGSNNNYLEGNLSIGTTSPQSLLSLYNSTDDALLSFGDGNSNTAHWFMGIDYDDSAKFKIATSSSLLSGAEFTITKNGDIGIGTTSPMAKLTLAGGAFLQTINSDPTLVGSVTDATNMSAAEGVYVSGNYAYVASYRSSSLSIIDISVPTNPVLVGSVSDNDLLYGASGVHVAGKYAYVNGEVRDTLVIVDVSNPGSPAIVGSIQDSTNIDTPEHTYVSGKYAYIAAENSNALTIIDISDPTNPVLTKAFVDNTVLAGIEAVYVRGKYAYTASQDNSAVGIVDISDPSNPFVAGSLIDANLGDPESIYVSGRYAYIAGEHNNSISVIDIASSTNPTVVSTLIEDTYLYNPEELYASGKYLYVVGHGDKFDATYDGDYISIVDVSDPNNPFVVGYLAGSSGMNIPYSVYVSGKYAYVASQGDDPDWAGSLAVIDIFGIDSPSASIGDLAVDTIDVAGNLQVANMCYVDSGINVGARGIFTDGSIISTATSSDSYFAGNVGIGTSSPQQIFTVDSGASATTTLELGDIYSGTGKTCFNISQADGSVGSFYFAGGDIVIENNVCR